LNEQIEKKVDFAEMQGFKKKFIRDDLPKS